MGKSVDGIRQLVSNGQSGPNHVINVSDRADYMQGTRISFRSKEDAIHFAEKQGTLILGQ